MILLPAILAYVKSNVGPNAYRDKGRFWDMYNDKTVCSWGWTEALQVLGQRLVYLTFSPESKGDCQTIVFDYIPEDEFRALA